MKQFKEEITAAFKSLRKQGFVARQNFKCCQTCAWAEMPEDAENVVFYHNQDTERAWNSRGRFDCLYLAWSGNGQAIADAFASQGFKVTWDGTTNQRIRISAE